MHRFWPQVVNKSLELASDAVSEAFNNQSSSTGAPQPDSGSSSSLALELLLLIGIFGGLIALYGCINKLQRERELKRSLERNRGDGSYRPFY